MSKKMVIGFTGKVVPKKPVNDQMTLCKCYVMALGKNQNKTNISKEASDNALPSLFNIPVVGHLFVDKNNNCRMGGHDMALEKDEDGNYKFKVLTVPYGTVPQQDDVHYEDVEENDGTIKTYLVADVILWTGRYPELLDAIYSKEIYFAQSMEINPYKTSKTDGYLDVLNYQYSALCLLGKSDDKTENVEPCFEQARVEPYEFSATEEWTKLFEEFKEELGKCYERHEIEEGGKKALNTETIKRILVEFGLSEDTQLSFEVAEDMTEETLKEKLKELYSLDTASQKEQPELEQVTQTENFEHSEEQTIPTENVGEPTKFAVELTTNEKRDKICGALCAENVWSKEEYIEYWLMDFDSEYVYCNYRHCSADVDEHAVLRIPYTMSDNNEIVLDMNKKESVRQCWLTKADEEKLDADKAAMDDLVAYKQARIEDDRRKEFALVLDEFKDLGEVDDYKEITKDVMAFENADALREKLYAVRGKYAKPMAKKPIAQIRIPVGFEAKKQNTELEEFMNKYLPNKK
jgi:hypothetical protein